MIAVIQRYKPVLIVIALIMAAILAWLIISRQNSNKIPSRGVFVMERMIDNGKGIDEKRI